MSSPLVTCVQAVIPTPAVRDPYPTVAFGPWDVHLRGLFPYGGK